MQHSPGTVIAPCPQDFPHHSGMIGSVFLSVLDSETLAESHVNLFLRLFFTHRSTLLIQTAK